MVKVLDAFVLEIFNVFHQDLSSGALRPPGKRHQVSQSWMSSLMSGDSSAMLPLVIGLLFFFMAMSISAF